jgi:hypothetical protein
MAGCGLTQVKPIFSRVIEAQLVAIGDQIELRRAQGTQTFDPEKRGPTDKKDFLGTKAFSPRRDFHLG